MKKIVTLLLCIVTVVSLLAACGKPAEDTTPATNEAGRPVVTIGIPENANVQYENNVYTQLIERLSGCDLEYVFFASNSGDYLTQLSLRVSGSEKLPDIIWGFNGMSEEVRNSYGEQGTFLDIYPMLMDKEMSAIWWERFEGLDPSIQQTVLTDMMDVETGEAYGFPTIIADPGGDVCSFYPMINKGWLEALNLEMPKNIEQLEDVLRHFKNDDPNGNGKKDEIPCMVQKGGTGARGLDYLINLFTYLDTTTGWLELDGNGNVICTATTEKYREALIWVNRMMKEGLIYKGSVDAGSADINTFFVTPGVDRLGMVVAHPSIGLASATDLIKQFVICETMKYTPIIQGQHLYCTFITESCTNVEAAWKVLMAMCTREAQLQMAKGTYGENYVDADPGTFSKEGFPAEFRTIKDDGLPTNKRWLLHGAGILTSIYTQKPNIDYDHPDRSQYRSLILVPSMVAYQRANAEKNNPAPEYICPKLVPNKEDRMDCPTWSTFAETFGAWRVKFMSGVKDPNSEADWAEYLMDLERGGFENYMYVAQAIYDREFKNK